MRLLRGIRTYLDRSRVKMQKSSTNHNFVNESSKSFVSTQEISCVYTRESLVSTQEIACVYTRDLLCLHKRFCCVYRRALLCIHKRSLVNTQKNLLCIHKRSLVHAQHSCACSGPGTPGARDPKKALGRSRALDRAFFGSLAPGVPGPKHAQECCACTRDLLCIHKRFLLSGLVVSK